MTPRRFLFGFTTILLPFIAFLLLEGALRVFDYGGELRLVVEREIFGRRFISINRAAARRWFTGPERLVPEFSEDYFLPVKPSNGIRVFCLGESTMAGFPYEYNATAPAMLRAALRSMIPDREVEVVNVGLSAVSSVIVREIVDELLEYDPDLFIVYAGHNEFYGIFGAASSRHVPGGAWLTDLYFASLRFRTVLLVRDAINAISGDGPDISAPSPPLMQDLSAGVPVAYGDPLYLSCRERFIETVETIIGKTTDAKIPLLLSMPVSNLSGIAPFVALKRGSVQDQTDSLRKEARAKSRDGNQAAAIAHYGEAVALDSTNAGLWFELAGLLVADDRPAEALEAFTNARDYDALRFRMSTDFGEHLASLAHRQGIPIARIDSAFKAVAPDGIIGNTLLLEHVHPNIGGYALMARTWAESIADLGLLPDVRSSPPPATDLPGLAGATRFDEAVGAIRIKFLTHQWPFDTTGRRYAFTPSNQEETIALRFIRKELSWQSARYALADYYQASGRYALARAEAFALSQALYTSYEPVLRIGDYYSLEGNATAALDAYRRSGIVEPNPFAPSRIGAILLQQGFPDAAIDSFLSALELHNRSRYQLPPRGLAMTYYLLGAAQVQGRRPEDAIVSLKKSLEIDGGLTEARQLLMQIEG